jgi:hypothetical protein
MLSSSVARLPLLKTYKASLVLSCLHTACSAYLFCFGGHSGSYCRPNQTVVPLVVTSYSGRIYLCAHYSDINVMCGLDLQSNVGWAFIFNREEIRGNLN